MAHFAKFVDMAKTPEQVNEEVSSMAAPMTAKADNVPKYPWGLCINLEDDQLEKLNLDDECEVGDMIHLCVMAKVTSCSSNETEGGKSRKRIELQITQIAVPVENEDNENEEMREHKKHSRYGDGEAEAA